MNSTVCLLDRAVQRFGDKVGFRDDETALTFSELRIRARAVGNGLRFAPPALPVIVLLPKSVAAITALMGVLSSGNPYVPLDYKTPLARLRSILDTLGDCLIISDEAGCERLEAAGLDALPLSDLLETPPDDAKLDRRVACVVDSDPAYVMFTSGSTGVPKGVAVPHRAVLDYACWVSDTFGFGTGDVLGNQAAFYFANSLFDLYGTLYSGATMHIIPEVLFTFPSKLPAYLAEQGITSIFWVPTVMKNIANSGVLDTVALPQLKTVVFCGEILSATYLNVWRRALPECTYTNLYGMTEAADACCAYVIDRDFSDEEALPIGQACRNMRVIVLNADGCEAAPGEVGELCVAGAGLALGYWGRDDLTAAAFVQDPREERFLATLYRSGDLGYQGEDGLLYVKGRRDSQVKVKGNRIELGEVERAAATLPEAQNVCVLFDAEAEQIVLLVQTDVELRLRPINQHLKTLLPDYMLPARLELLKQFPLTASGKIDRMTLRKTYGLR